MKKLCLLAIAVVMALFWGCGPGALPHPRWVGQPTSALTEVPYPPPAARVEFVPKQPSDRAVWIDGEWTWGGRRWAWRAGRWIVPPADSLTAPLYLPASFSPWTTVRNGAGTLFFAEGSWRDVRGGEVTEPAPLAIGTANETDSSSPDAGRGASRRRRPVVEDPSEPDGGP